MKQKIKYEPHPVSPERKAELRAQGYKIIDAVFAPKPTKREALDAALNQLPGENTDPDYVVGAMRSHFGDAFTEADEARVRDVVKLAQGKPSDGLKVDEIKEALAAKNIAIPEGVSLKADLAELLDAAG